MVQHEQVLDVEANLKRLAVLRSKPWRTGIEANPRWDAPGVDRCRVLWADAKSLRIVRNWKCR